MSTRKRDYRAERERRDARARAAGFKSYRQQRYAGERGYRTASSYNRAAVAAAAAGTHVPIAGVLLRRSGRRISASVLGRHADRLLAELRLMPRDKRVRFYFDGRQFPRGRGFTVAYAIAELERAGSFPAFVKAQLSK